MSETLERRVWSARLRSTARVLKEKHPNYTVDQALDIAEAILAASDEAEARIREKAE